MQHFDCPTGGVGCYSCRLGCVYRGKGLHMLGLEVLRKFGLRKVSDKTADMVLARQSLGDIAVGSVDC